MTGEHLAILASGVSLGLSLYRRLELRGDRRRIRKMDARMRRIESALGQGPALQSEPTPARQAKDR